MRRVLIPTSAGDPLDRRVLTISADLPARRGATISLIKAITPA